jgi:hypothetical protein
MQESSQDAVLEREKRRWEERKEEREKDKKKSDIGKKPTSNDEVHEGNCLVKTKVSQR